MAEPEVVELLVVGGESDPNTRRIADQAALRGVRFCVADTDDPKTSRIGWNFDDAALTIGDREFAPSAIFARHNVFRATSPAIHSAIREYAAAWPRVNILNRRTLGANNSKSANLRTAAAFGFDVPATMVTDGRGPLAVTDPHAWITKPLLGGRHTIPALGLAEAVEAGERPGMHFLQQRLDGTNVRVFVVGGQTFAFEIRTERLDYREVDDCEVVFVPTPAALVRPCIALADRLGFDYCAIDLRGRESDDDLHFLEINSFPMFVRFDTASENRVADRILSVLLGREINESTRSH